MSGGEAGLSSLDLKHGRLQVAVLLQPRANEVLQDGVGEDLFPRQVAEAGRIGCKGVGIGDRIPEQTLDHYIVGPMVFIVYVATV